MEECKLLVKYNLKPALVEACRDLELQVSGKKEELARRIVKSGNDGAKLAYLVRGIEQIDLEDLEFSFKEPKGEVSGTKTEVVEKATKESTRTSLELMKSIKTMEEGCNVEVFIKRFQLALAAAGLSPQCSDATSWLLMKVSDDIQFRLQEYFVNIEEISSTILCGKLRNWYSTNMTKTEAECELMAFKLDQKNVEDSLKKLKNLVSAQNVHLSRKDDRIRYEILRQLREIPNLKNLGLIGRNFSLDELEAELKIECKLRNLHINKNNDEKKNFDKKKIKKCFECQQLGHIKPDCPNIKKEGRISNIIEEVEDSNEYTIDASIMVNGLVKTVKVFPDYGSKISCLNPKLVRKMDLTLSEKKRKGALADGSPIIVNIIEEQIELTLNGKKIKMKDVWVLDIKHDLLIGTRTLCECDFVIKWTKPIDDDKRMMTLCGEEQEVELKCEIIEKILDVWLEPDFDLELFKFNSPNTELSNSKISEHDIYEPPSAMRNELSHQIQMGISTEKIQKFYKLKLIAGSISIRKKGGTVKLCQDLCVLNKMVRKVRKKSAYWIKMVSIIVHIIKNTMKKGKLDNQNAMNKVIKIKNSESEYPSMIVQNNMDRRCSQIAPPDKVREVTDSGITGPLKVVGRGEKN
uniref:CCHC-type domain-containing protein n=1 Tax=Strongyloides venezuelensis TaxID=75913 RepID=A0A0K0G4J1_STRVS